MTRDEAIKAIDANWPTENYTMLREALTLAKDALRSRPAPPDDRGTLRAIEYACSVYGGWDMHHEQYLDSLLDSMHEAVGDAGDGPDEHLAALLRQATEAVTGLRRTRDDARKAIIELSKAALAAPAPLASLAPPDDLVANQAYGYLSRLLITCAPQCQPLPDLLGLCSQIDNLIAGLRAPAPVAAPPADLVALVREWQEARKPATLSAPGEFLAETFQAAVRRMSAADEALAAYQLDGPAGGALVGQTAPTESTGPYLCACTCGCGDRTIRPGRCMVCRVRESCLKNEWTCEACAAGYRLAADGMHYDHDDSTWGVCRKVVASFRREEP